MSVLGSAIQTIEGVKKLRIISPAGDILPTGLAADSGSSGVGFNELIVLGKQNIRVYYEPGLSSKK